MDERYEEYVFHEGYKRGFEDGRKSVKTKQIKYYDEDEEVWTIGEVVVNDEDIQSTDER